jgi:hypothetical protein
MMRKTFYHFRCIALFFSFFTTSLPVKANNSFDSNCHNALYELLRLNYSKSTLWINKEIQTNPDNIYIPYLQNYLGFVKVVLNEIPADYTEYSQNTGNRMSAICNSSQNKDLQQCLMAEMNLHSSVIFAKYNDKIKALKFLYAAQRNILNYKKINPSGIEINKAMAVVLQINSYLPQFVKNFIPSSLIKSKPVDLLNKYRNSVSTDSVLSLESNILWTFYNNQFSTNLQLAYTETKEMLIKYPDNPLLITGLAFIAARSGCSIDALNVLKNLSSKISCEDRLSYLQYFTGVLTLNAHLEGKKYFEKFLATYQGNTYKKAAWLKLGWVYFLSGDTTHYLECRKKAYYLGTSWSEQDASAQNEAKNKDFPNLYLLKARLLFDGGLYHDARTSLLDKKTLASLKKRGEQLEFLYRLARINHEEKDLITAKKYYTQVIDLGKTEPYYFAANSALNLGYIFEQENNLITARDYYQLCLKINKYEYASSIGAKARAGLKRVNP